MERVRERRGRTSNGKLVLLAILGAGFTYIAWSASSQAPTTQSYPATLYVEEVDKNKVLAQDVVPEVTSAEDHGQAEEDHDVYQVVNGVKERATLLHSNWRPESQALSRGSSMDDDADEHAQPVDQSLEHIEYQRKVCAEFAPNTLSTLDPSKAYLPSTHSDRFMQYLCERQFTEFSSALAMPFLPIVLYADDDESAGLGARMLRVACALWTAVGRGRSLVGHPRGHWLYTSTAACPGKNNDCYFQAVTTAENLKMVDDEIVHRLYPSSAPLPSTLKDTAVALVEDDPPLGGGEWMTQWTRDSLNAFYKKEGRGQDWLRDKVPNFRQKSGCWLIGQLMFFLMQANAGVDALAKKAREELGFKHPIVAMHVRHGDRAQRGQVGALFDLSKYMAEAKKIAPHVKNVLLMTEDQEVIDDTAKFPDYTFVYTNYPRMNIPIGPGIKEGTIDARDELHNALLNLYMAVDSDYFVGGLGSSWARLVLMLSYGKYNCMQSHATLGSSWSSKWEYGMCTTKDYTDAVAHHTCKYSKPNKGRMF